MVRKRFSAEEIIGKLREAEVLLAQGSRAATARPSGSRRPCDRALGATLTATSRQRVLTRQAAQNSPTLTFACCQDGPIQ